MITLSILTVVLLSIMIIAAAIAVVCGAGFIVVFGDLIVAAIVIALIVKLFRRKR